METEDQEEGECEAEEEEEEGVYGSMRRCKGGEGRGNLRQIGETVEVARRCGIC